MSSISDVDAGFAWFESFLQIDRGTYRPRAGRLARMRRMLAAFDDPHLACRTVHVAGSKGKGSTAVLIASALDAAGLRCGLYTSPHVEDYRERIRVLDGSLTDELLVEVFRSIESYVGRIAGEIPSAELPTTFELLTLLGFLVFRDTRCDIAVIEVGIGGRTDATNVIRPVASVVTRIEIEHSNLLGSTLRAIAAEKGGIIKEGVPVFVGAQRPESMQTLRRIARMRAAPFHSAEEEIVVRNVAISSSGTQFSLSVGSGHRVDARIRLIGEVQAENAGLAALVLARAFPEIRQEVALAGFARASIPGRSELVPGAPVVLLDGAHTEESIRRLCETARAICPERDRRVAIFGSVAGKNHRPMLAPIVESFSRVVIARPGSFRESSTPALLALCRSLGGSCVLCDEISDAFGAARAFLGATRPSEGLIVVAGSFYLVGEARGFLRAEGSVRR